jgi:hypothetical protein
MGYLQPVEVMTETIYTILQLIHKGLLHDDVCGILFCWSFNRSKKTGCVSPEMISWTKSVYVHGISQYITCGLAGPETFVTFDKSLRDQWKSMGGIGNVEPWEPWRDGSRGGEEQFSHGR